MHIFLLDLWGVDTDSAELLSKIVAALVIKLRNEATLLGSLATGGAAEAFPNIIFGNLYASLCISD